MTERRLDGLKAVVTGGSDGLGRAIAAAFAEYGADLWLVSRGRDRLAAAETLRANGGEVRVTAADLTDAADLARAGAEIAAAWPRLDVLVNNAGMARFTPFAEVPAEEVEAQVRLNLLAPYLLTQKLRPSPVSTRVEDRALRGRNPSADAGAETEAGGDGPSGSPPGSSPDASLRPRRQAINPSAAPASPS